MIQKTNKSNIAQSIPCRMDPKKLPEKKKYLIMDGYRDIVLHIAALDLEIERLHDVIYKLANPGGSK